MITIETVKYQNDYTGEMFDNYEECFDSEARFMFSRDNTGIIAVLDGGRVGDIIEAFNSDSVSGLDPDVCNDNYPDTLIFIPSINANDENYPSFISAAEANLIIRSFR